MDNLTFCVNFYAPGDKEPDKPLNGGMVLAGAQQYLKSLRQQLVRYKRSEIVVDNPDELTYIMPNWESFCTYRIEQETHSQARTA